MASTRNKNTAVNYRQEIGHYQAAHRNVMYEHGSNGSAYDNKWAGIGLNPGKMPSNKLSSNSADIESFLLGINSTNLVNPAGPLHPDLYCLSSANLFSKGPVYMPDPMVIEKGQRPAIP
jgi:hypothetical protein